MSKKSNSKLNLHDFTLKTFTYRFEDVPVENTAAGTNNDDDFDVFASDDEEESELKRQHLEAYVKAKANSNHTKSIIICSLLSLRIFRTG